MRAAPIPTTLGGVEALIAKAARVAAGHGT